MTSSSQPVKRTETQHLTEGQETEVVDGVTMTVSGIEVLSGWEGQAWASTHTMTVRVENRSGETTQSPYVEIRCTVAPDGVYNQGSFYASSTYETRFDMPDGSFHEGTFDIQLPSDDYGVYVPGCVEPFMEWHVQDPKVGDTVYVLDLPGID